jgi:hypothetical protein
MIQYNPKPVNDNLQNQNNEDLKIIINELVKEIEKLKAVK